VEYNYHNPDNKQDNQCANNNLRHCFCRVDVNFNLPFIRAQRRSNNQLTIWNNRTPRIKILMPSRNPCCEILDVIIDPSQSKLSIRQLKPCVTHTKLLRHWNRVLCTVHLSPYSQIILPDKGVPIFLAMCSCHWLQEVVIIVQEVQISTYFGFFLFRVPLGTYHTQRSLLTEIKESRSQCIWSLVLRAFVFFQILKSCMIEIPTVGGFEFIVISVRVDKFLSFWGTFLASEGHNLRRIFVALCACAHD